MPQAESNKTEKVSWLSKLVRGIILSIYKRHGWQATGEVPSPRKFVIVAAPHTSNWDFVYFLGLVDELKINASFMAKKSLFRWPFGNFMRQMGGIEIDRNSSKNYVQAMVDEFEARDEFMLTIAAEGTRGSVRQWKTGFYQIALQAGVPIVVGMMDYAKKSGGLGPAIMPSGDYEADMKIVSEFYRSVTPKHPDKAMAKIV